MHSLYTQGVLSVQPCSPTVHVQFATGRGSRQSVSTPCTKIKEKPFHTSSTWPVLGKNMSKSPVTHQGTCLLPKDVTRDTSTFPVLQHAMLHMPRANEGILCQDCVAKSASDQTHCTVVSTRTHTVVSQSAHFVAGLSLLLRTTANHIVCRLTDECVCGCVFVGSKAAACDMCKSYATLR